MNQSLACRWISREGSAELATAITGPQTLSNHTSRYVKDLVYERKKDTYEDITRQTVAAATCIHDRDTFRRFTGSVAGRVKMCLEAEGGHFELFLQL